MQQILMNTKQTKGCLDLLFMEEFACLVRILALLIRVVD